MSLRVLIVDDDDVVLFLHRVMAMQSNLCNKPLTFLNGHRILEYLKEHHAEEEKFLLLLDINMPLMDGWEFLDTLKSEPYAEKVSVIMVTSSVNVYDKQKAQEYKEVIHFVEKPISIDICSGFKNLKELEEHF